jgi:uncharacterized membrane protein
VVATLRSRRRLAVLVSLASLSAFTVAGVVVRWLHTGTLESANLAWNLFLAWIPLVVALAVYDAHRRHVRPAWLLAGGGLWLLFFPNAPYLVTDLKHLASWSGAPEWFDVVLVSSAAWTGLLLGFVSLFLVQAVARTVLGPVAAWGVVVGSLALGSFGIYLGRFERWNSWDALTRPRDLAGDVFAGLASPLQHPRVIAVTLLFTAFLTLSYLTLYALLELGRGEREPL